MDTFQFVKEQVSTKTVAIHYGYRPNRAGLICCPFHDDKNPSMKVDKRYYCYGCGATGDVIDFVGNYFGLKPMDAAKKILSDFGIGPRDQKKLEVVRAKQLPVVNKRREMTLLIRRLLDYLHLLDEWKVKYAPKTRQEEWHELFVKSLDLQVRVNYYLDGLMFGGKEECQEFYDFYKEEVEQLGEGMETSERKYQRRTRSK